MGKLDVVINTAVKVKWDNQPINDILYAKAHVE